MSEPASLEKTMNERTTIPSPAVRAVDTRLRRAPLDELRAKRVPNRGLLEMPPGRVIYLWPYIPKNEETPYMLDQVGSPDPQFEEYEAPINFDHLYSSVNSLSDDI